MSLKMKGLMVRPSVRHCGENDAGERKGKNEKKKKKEK
jgi:hypothetical protein